MGYNSSLTGYQILCISLFLPTWLQLFAPPTSLDVFFPNRQTHANSPVLLNIDSGVSTFMVPAATWNEAAVTNLNGEATKLGWPHLQIRIGKCHELNNEPGWDERTRLLASVSEGSSDWLQFAVNCINRSQTRWFICPASDWTSSGFRLVKLEGLSPSILWCPTGLNSKLSWVWNWGGLTLNWGGGG